MNLEKQLQKIDRAVERGAASLPWLLEQLSADAGTVRCAVVSAIERLGLTEQIESHLLQRLAHEDDQDVVARLVSTLASANTGSKNIRLYDQLEAAVTRFDPCYSGTRGSLEDARLRIMSGLSSVEIVKLTPSKRSAMLAETQSHLKSRN